MNDQTTTPSEMDFDELTASLIEEDQQTEQAMQTISELDSGFPLFYSPILAQLPEARLPNPSPACETCPVSMWFATKEVLKCYCARMHTVVWDKDAAEFPILQCDGRELALRELEAALAKE
ncbi:hypothetical protein [Pseudomonas sp. JG-B]|uniref:hypothetical protein n=1 Tax=Pseudomonas sp. JG-B TaxID=2603214 RepID=UPI0021153421|nr:hypothetical protein [Pseudomonas sp. JG-B]